ncbi:MAG: ABC transporter permease [Sphaerochaetaceae bacterium]|jgi:spermidine/putrescine transport system permease protein
MSKRHPYRQQHPFNFSSVVLYLTVIFLFIPLFVVTFFSFNSAKGMQWQSASLIWYKRLIFDSPSLWVAFKNSIIIALSSSLSATLIGTLAAIGIKWHRFKGKGYITAISYMPMVLPEVIIGVSMLIFFTAVKINLGMFTIFAAHTTFNLPFVFMLVSARLDEFDYSTIEAARDLGANERQALVKVVIPTIMPAILSSFLMCVTMSLEDFVITFFVSGPGSGTLPLYVYSMIRYGVSPVINALSFVIILGTMLIAFSFRRFLKTVAASS